MTDINKELRAELDKIFAYGIDWTEYKDKSENDHQVSTFAGKIKEELKDELVAKIKALVVESLVDGRQISSYHDLYSGKSKEWTDGYRQGFDMCKELVLALWK